MEIEVKSSEFYALISTANALTRDYIGEYGEVFAQIGVNFEPCPKSCKFCSMGEKWNLVKKPVRLSVEEVTMKINEYLKEGANTIFLMTTADYPFEEFIKVGKVVRDYIPDDMPLVANIGDFGAAEAHKLVEVGFTGFYHVVRLREGIDTEISVNERVHTIKSALKAGLQLYYCVEPIGPEHTTEEVIESIFLAKTFKPIGMAAMRRIPIDGTPLAIYGTISEAELSKVVAIARLVFGDEIYAMAAHEPTMLPLLAGANQLYAEVGSNPRDTIYDTSKVGFSQLLDKRISFSVHECKRMLMEAGYKVTSRPSPYAHRTYATL
ncbi:MAG: radical SAM protein [archaeon]|nr:radical SAM protein [archaeon]